MSLRKLLTIGIIVLLFAGSFLAGMLLNTLYYPPRSGRGRTVRVTVKSGEPFSLIAYRLFSEGLIDHPEIMNLYAVLCRYDRVIHAGTYEMTVGERPKEVLDKLVRGDVLKVSVTIPEGYTLWEIAGVLGSEAGVDSGGFIAFAQSRKEVSKFNIDAPTLEGYLYPETYVFSWGIGLDEIARTMISKMNSVFDDSLRDRAERLGIDMNQALTLASIIEAEARLPEERPLVSAVYHNRLRRGMKLEADPTVAYAMGGYRGRLLHANLQINSLYNTYLHQGLPPGPICSSGKASILAALYPDSTCGALYFVARGDGGHIFSLTLNEHLKAVAALKKRHKTGF